MPLFEFSGGLADGVHTDLFVSKRFTDQEVWATIVPAGDKHIRADYVYRADGYVDPGRICRRLRFMGHDRSGKKPCEAVFFAVQVERYNFREDTIFPKTAIVDGVKCDGETFKPR